jgi:hypothetical protein
MNWLKKIIGRDNAQERIQSAHQQRQEAAQNLAESRELGSRLRAHDQRNHLTERMAAAFATNERHRRRHV